MFMVTIKVTTRIVIVPVIKRIVEFSEDMAVWRRDLHAHPETAF